MVAIGDAAMAMWVYSSEWFSVKSTVGALETMMWSIPDHDQYITFTVALLVCTVLFVWMSVRKCIS